MNNSFRAQTIQSTHTDDYSSRNLSQVDHPLKQSERQVPVINLEKRCLLSGVSHGILELCTGLTSLSTLLTFDLVRIVKHDYVYLTSGRRFF